jgi:Predicted integral membrane protein (DUF2269)
MAWLFPYLLFLHVMGAILAFGPTYAYSIIGAMGGREPMHANFGARVTARIGTALVYPLAILQGVTGVALILVGGIAVMEHMWLTAGILLYLVALVFALTVQRGWLHRVIELGTPPGGGPPAGGPPAGGPPAGGPPAGGPPAGGPPAGGPPPELFETVRKIQRGGMFLGLLIVVIVFLMVVKPGG